MASREPPGGGSTMQWNSGGIQTNIIGPSERQTGPSTNITNQNTNTRTSESESSVRNLRETTNRNVNQTIRTENMDPASLAALEQLIATLSQGGTPEQQAAADQILEQIGRSRQQESDYSKSAAFNDATRVADIQSERAIRELMPTITAGIDSAGTSGSAMSALLAQDAANRAADLAATLSLETAVQYGQIKNQALANTTNLINQMTEVRNDTVDQLLGALQIAKGAVVTETTNVRDRTVRQATETTQSQRSASSSTNSTTISSDSGNTIRDSGSTNQTIHGPSTTITTPYSSQGGVGQPGANPNQGNRINPYVTVVGGGR